MFDNGALTSARFDVFATCDAADFADGGACCPAATCDGSGITAAANTANADGVVTASAGETKAEALAATLG